MSPSVKCRLKRLIDISGDSFILFFIGEKQIEPGSEKPNTALSGRTGFAERLGTREMNSLPDFFEIPEEKTK